MTGLLPVCERPSARLGRSRPWLDLGLLAVLAAVAVALAPAGPRPWLAGAPWAAVAVAALGGAALAVAVDRGAGRPSSGRSPGAAAASVLLLASAGEEAAWRAGFLAALAVPLGPFAALALSAAAFGAVHGPGRARRLLHCGSGLAFGTAYLAGGLGAACTCHCAYTLVLLAGERRSDRRPAPWQVGQ